MLREIGGFDVPDLKGAPLGDGPQEIYTSARMVHSFGLAKQFGFEGCEDVIDAGMEYLWNVHCDQTATKPRPNEGRLFRGDEPWWHTSG